MDRHPCPAMAALMKLSFDEDHRHAMCLLGGLHAIAELIRRDHDGHGSTTSDQYCITLRRLVLHSFFQLKYVLPFSSIERCGYLVDELMPAWKEFPFTLSRHGVTMLVFTLIVCNIKLYQFVKH